MCSRHVMLTFEHRYHCAKGNTPSLFSNKSTSKKATNGIVVIVLLMKIKIVHCNVNLNLIKCYLRKSSFNILYITKSIRSCAARQINMRCVISGCCSVGSKDGRLQVKCSDHVPISINTTKELHVILNCFRNASNMVKFCEMSVFCIAIFLSLLGYSGESMYKK